MQCLEYTDISVLFDNGQCSLPNTARNLPTNLGSTCAVIQEHPTDLISRPEKSILKPTCAHKLTTYLPI